MAKTTINELESLINKLQAERRGHVDAIAEIDAVFEQFGIKPAANKRRRPAGSTMPAAKRAARRGSQRRTFKVSGAQSIVTFVIRSGKNGVTGADIVKHWESEGRAGGAYKEIGKLVSARRLKKRPLKGQRGSRYMMA